MENYGQKRAEYLLEMEIIKLRNNTTKDTIVKDIVNKAVECTNWLRKD